ncbi:MAG: PHB depolymerase family esterase [Phenylobacterium sp.]
MAGLGETTAMLANLRRQAAGFTFLAQPGEAMTETASFGANPGALRMLSYLPEGLPKGASLVVVLHGCAQKADAYASDGGWLALADRYGFAVIAPEQSAANNPNRCFNWFSPGDTARGQGEAASIHAMVRHAVKAHGLDPRRVFVTGLSAGGAMTAALLAAYPDSFAAGAVVAGLPHGAADNLQEALRAMHGGSIRTSAELAKRLRKPVKGGRLPRLAIWHGAADATVSPRNALATAGQWAAAHGLAETPDELQTLPGRTRAIWRAPATGEVLIESNLVAGLGHGTPLATLGEDGLGAVAPYMLEAGVSSSLEIARFWGIAEEAAVSPMAFVAPGSPQPAAGLGDQVMAVVARHVPDDVQGVIAKALKAAGLMK